MIGKIVGHYRIIEALGKGGMGEVYAAEDLRLKRTIALKVLPQELAGRPERRERFEREAQALAALNHPHIVTVHSVEEADGIPFLTMELVSGRTLTELIPEGGLPLARFFDLAIPLASAVGAAHAHGITHRDLKPDNVMLTDDGRLKVLDFGLAKAAGDPIAGPDAATRGPTLTQQGQILGTVAYLSPEQVEGKPADARSDVFALGIVLYEMATGRRPFSGEGAVRTMSAILSDTPPPMAQRNVPLPEALGRIVSRCLEKAPDARPQDGLEVQRLLEQLRDETGAAPGRTATRPVRWLAVSGLGLVGLAALAYVLFDRSRGTERDRAGSGAGSATRQLAQWTFDATLEEWPAWSPDGMRIVYTAERDGFKKLVVKTIAGGAESQTTSGPNDDIQPAWSPDGARIAFVRSSQPGGKLEPADVLSGEYMGGDIWTIELASGEERKIVENAYDPSFSPDGARIAFDASWAGPRRIWVSDANGRNPQQVTTDQSEAVVHTQPQWSPDGTKLVFQSAEKTRFDARVVDLASKVTVSVTDDEFQDLSPVWSPDGAWVYFSSHRGGGLNVWRVPVSRSGEPTGKPEQLTTGAGQDVQPAPSPDGRRLIFSVLQQNANLWRLPLDPTTGAATGEPESLVSTTREDSRGAWSPDGASIAFNSDRAGSMNLWVRSLVDGAERRLTSGAGGDYQPIWSPDGRALVFFSSRGGNADIWTVEVASGKLTRLTDDPALDVNPFWSADGLGIAFQSDREGRLEIWAMHADGSEQRRLADVGATGHFLRFSPDSAWVYFRSGDRQLYRVPAAGGAPEKLGALGGAHISFSPDFSRVIDVTGHKAVWVYPLDGRPPLAVFEFDDPDVRIDYPVWSPDGHWLLFDRVAPQGGDVWALDGLR